MRISILCSDFNRYLDCPEDFLPKEVQCLRDPSHKTHKHTGWERFSLLPDHVTKKLVPMFRWFCPECKESISIWPEFILPYQPELLETHEQALVEHINGTPIVDTAKELGYDPRTVSRWIKRILNQALLMAPRTIPRILQDLTCEILPFCSTYAFEVVQELLAWLYRYAQFISFPRLCRLMGLCNVLGQGRLIIWGGAIGRCRYSREITESSPANSPPGRGISNKPWLL